MLMAALLMAQHVWGSWGIGEFAIAIIIIVGIVAIVIAGVKYSGVQIPPIVVTVAWIVFAVFVCVIGIRILMSL